MMTITKNYLSSAEIAFIVETMLQKETWYEREIVKYSLVAEFCIKELKADEFESSNDIYDAIFEDGVGEALEFDIVNFDIIDKIIDKETSTSQVIIEMFNDLGSKLEEFAKQADANNLKASVESLQKELTKVADNNG